MNITKDSLIVEILNEYPEVAVLFMDMGMHCVGCFASQMETLEQACSVHGLSADDVLEDIAEFIRLG